MLTGRGAGGAAPAAADGRRTCGRAAQETRGESVSSSDCGQRAGRTRARRGMFGAVSCRVDLRARSASLDAAQEAVTAGAAHRHRSVLKRRSCRHRGGDRARRAHDKTCVRDGGELGRGWWAENASRYGRAGPRRAPRRNRALRTNRRNRRADSPSPNTTRGPPPPVSQSENSDCTSRKEKIKELRGGAVLLGCPFSFSLFSGCISVSFSDITSHVISSFVIQCFFLHQS